MILAYIAAAAAANLLVAHYGPPAVIPVAFFLIGFDLIVRDHLHDRWSGDRLALRMAALIAAGGAAAWAANPSAGRIAIASVVAFIAAGATDAAVYHALRRRPFMVRANGSNVPAAIVDSALFLTVAFGVGAVPLTIMAGQVAAKVGGGAVWSAAIARYRYARYRRAVPPMWRCDHDGDCARDLCPGVAADAPAGIAAP